MNEYYRARIEEAPVNSFAVIGSIILAAGIVVLKLIF